MMSDGQPPFKTLLGHGTVKDQYGHPMSKSMGNSIEFVAAADEGGTILDAKGKELPFAAIGADVMRWLYCRHDPAKNLNFGPEPANEVRAKFHIKLWNCYAFFANYARLDGFDPAGPPVPWGIGFSIQAPNSRAPYGDFAPVGTVGHGGASGCRLIIDLEDDIVIGIVTNTHAREGRERWMQRLDIVSNGVMAALT